MQCIKLVNAGFVDRVIVFDELPKRLMEGVKTRDAAGFPRSWARWLADIGSTRPVFKTETTLNRAETAYTFAYTKIGVEPCFFVLEYSDLNADKEKWRAIGEYLRLHCGPDVRLKEKTEDMAISFARDSKSPLEIEPEDVPVVKVPNEVELEHKPEDIIPQGETIIVQEVIATPKRRGRPKKEKVVA